MGLVSIGKRRTAPNHTCAAVTQSPVPSCVGSRWT
jgi:hypothetical protein